MPLGAHLVQVRVANAAEGDIDLHVMGAGGTTGNLQWFQRLVARMGAIGVD